MTQNPSLADCRVDAPELTDALKTLTVFGGNRLGFTLSTPEILSPEHANEMIARKIARAAYESLGASFTWVAEDTTTFGARTPEHLDGLHIAQPFLQVHTTHASSERICSRIMLREYRITAKLDGIIRDAADQYSRTGQTIDGIRTYHIHFLKKLNAPPPY